MKFALLLVLASAVNFLFSAVVFAQREGSNDTAATTDEQSVARESPIAAAGADKHGLDKEAEKAKLRSSVMAGLLVLSLICIVFLVLVILVALWARRIRLMTQQPLPEMHPGDPLWYLRKGKPSDSPELADNTPPRNES